MALTMNEENRRCEHCIAEATDLVQALIAAVGAERATRTVGAELSNGELAEGTVAAVLAWRAWALENAVQTHEAIRRAEERGRTLQWVEMEAGAGAKDGEIVVLGAHEP